MCCTHTNARQAGRQQSRMQQLNRYVINDSSFGVYVCAISSLALAAVGSRLLHIFRILLRYTYTYIQCLRFLRLLPNRWLLNACLLHRALALKYLLLSLLYISMYACMQAYAAPINLFSGATFSFAQLALPNYLFRACNALTSHALYRIICCRASTLRQHVGTACFGLERP